MHMARTDDLSWCRMQATWSCWGLAEDHWPALSGFYSTLRGGLYGAREHSYDCLAGYISLPLATIGMYSSYLPSPGAACWRLCVQPRAWVWVLGA